jgi:1-deoxy-D-xylulose-5-phosphate synthase
MAVLPQIQSPADLRRLSPNQLPALAAEIRERIIDVVATNSGHLSSNLGVVELTLALHYLFNTPHDKIVWDTSNQTYTHKLLTGRQANFHTLRQWGGVSGFAKREESPYDVFNAGHAGTGVSAAVGFVAARELSRDDHRVICVVGDGALTSGMTYEGLNQAGALQKDFLLILNDNEMSISKNVGAISSYLSRLLTGPLYTTLKEDAKAILKAIPAIGESMLRAAKVAEESAKGLISPALLFEELGFLYVGPIDGQRFDHLLPTLENLKRLKGPVFLHVITKKGLGYEPAERDPVFFHSAPPFVRETGKPLYSSPVPSYTNIFTRTLIHLARENSKIVGVTAAMPGGTGLSGVAEEFPDRVYDVGIAEQHAVTFAAGLAAEGYKPVVAMYATFLQRGFDQILHDVCIQNLPVAFCIDRAGIVAEDGATHHGIFDLAFLRHIPNMVIMAPKDENELQHMIKTAVDYAGPIAVRYPRGSGLGVPLDPEPRPLKIGKGEMLRNGNDVAILALGSRVAPALEAAEQLDAEGISAGVVNARFVKPLDRDLICSIAARCKSLVTVEEHVLQAGFGSAVLELLAAEGLLSGLKVRCVGIDDAFPDQGPQAFLRRHHGLDADSIAQATRKLLGVSPKTAQPQLAL